MHPKIFSPFQVGIQCRKLTQTTNSHYCANMDTPYTFVIVFNCVEKSAWLTHFLLIWNSAEEVYCIKKTCGGMESGTGIMECYYWTGWGVQVLLYQSGYYSADQCILRQQGKKEFIFPIKYWSSSIIVITNAHISVQRGKRYRKEKSTSKEKCLLSIPTS